MRGVGAEASKQTPLEHSWHSSGTELCLVREAPLPILDARANRANLLLKEGVRHQAWWMVGGELGCQGIWNTRLFKITASFIALWINSLVLWTAITDRLQRGKVKY